MLEGKLRKMCVVYQESASLSGDCCFVVVLVNAHNFIFMTFFVMLANDRKIAANMVWQTACWRRFAT